MKSVSTRDSWNHWWIEWTPENSQGFRIRKYCGWIEYLYQIIRRKPRVPEIKSLELITPSRSNCVSCGAIVLGLEPQSRINYYLVESAFKLKEGQCTACNRADYDKWVATPEGQLAMTQIQQIQQNWQNYFKNV